MGCQDFWQKKYQGSISSQHGFDWFFKSEDIVFNLQKILLECVSTRRKQTLHVLDLGCGTSLMPIVLFRELKKINIPSVLHCVDFSSNAISFQRRTFLNDEYYCNNNSLTRKATSDGEGDNVIVMDEASPCVNFVVGDAFRLPFSNNFFDIIIDKGTVDSVLRSNDADPLTKSQALIQQAVSCLCKGGVLLQISDEDPDSRLSLIEDSVRTFANMISITHIKLTTDTHFNYFMYFIKK